MEEHLEYEIIPPEDNEDESVCEICNCDSWARTLHRNSQTNFMYRCTDHLPEDYTTDPMIEAIFFLACWQIDHEEEKKRKGIM